MNWKRIAGRSLAGLTGLLVVAALGGYLYLRSGSFQQYALRKIVAEADEGCHGIEEASGGRGGDGVDAASEHGVDDAETTG